jgi:hypothetical protein
MASKPVAMLLADLGVTKTHSRPHCPNDNPFSEAQFKTMKYRPEFPDRFGGPEDARVFCTRFFPWYNDEHRHSEIGYHTPADVRYGRAGVPREQRAEVLTAAYLTHPERFARKPPQPPRLPMAAWINKPQEEVCPVLHRAGFTTGLLGWLHRAADRGLGHPASSQPDLGTQSGEPGPQAPDPRSRHQVRGWV